MVDHRRCHFSANPWKTLDGSTNWATSQQEWGDGSLPKKEDISFLPNHIQAQIQDKVKDKDKDKDKAVLLLHLFRLAVQASYDDNHTRWNPAYILYILVFALPWEKVQVQVQDKGKDQDKVGSHV